MVHANGQGPPTMAIRNGHMILKYSQHAGLTRRWFDTRWVSKNLSSKNVVGTRKMYTGWETACRQ